MSYTIDELEAACKQFEQDFFGGQACQNVRNVLVNVIRGGTQFKKRKLRSIDKRPIKRQRPMRDVLSNKPNKMVGGQDTPLTSPMPQSPDTFKPTTQSTKSFKPMTPSPNHMETPLPPTSSNDQTSINSPQDVNPASNSTFFDRVKYLNSKGTNLKLMMSTNRAMESAFKKLGLVKYMPGRRKTNYSPVKIEELDGGGVVQVRPPMGNTLPLLIVWRNVLEDFCDQLVNHPGYDQISIQDQVEFIKQVYQIMTQSPILMSMQTPMLESLVFKMCVSAIFLGEEE